MKDEVTAYIAGQEPWKQTVLSDLRRAVHDADPHIKEVIKWGSPVFEHDGQIAWMFCATNWVNFSFRQGALLDASHGLWVEGPDTGVKANRTMRFVESDEVPADIIRHLVSEAVKNNLEGRRVEFNIPKPGSMEFELPAHYVSLLVDAGVYELFENRPYYQQKGWVQWIEGAKRQETRQRRTQEMIHELEDGTYMPSKKMERP
jgi:hypothetical protein